MWVRLLELPIEYYEQEVLREIGWAIGPVHRVDTYTATESQGQFARLCVQISLDRPLIKLLWIGGLEQLVLYEGLAHCASLVVVLVTRLRHAHTMLGHQSRVALEQEKTTRSSHQKNSSDSEEDLEIDLGPQGHNQSMEVDLDGRSGSTHTSRGLITRARSPSPTTGVDGTQDADEGIIPPSH
ncbi:hypothetical protein CMV_007639 [Castanea mollissima]|uniref:DUF4283 domain-containing protein n=1 Tax=Castanea mollissima TaxID=60419 RepID=A0A8J4W2P2_9ROSI|nr:hypothetical protein CMV_007639 [Castanea mollissima]